MDFIKSEYESKNDEKHIYLNDLHLCTFKTPIIDA